MWEKSTFSCGLSLNLISLYIIILFICIVSANGEDLNLNNKNKFAEDKSDFLSLQLPITTQIENSKFPRNISDIYKGEWKFDFEHASIGKSKLGLEKQKGLYVMSLTCQPSNFSEELDVVKGFVDIGDGYYSTSDYKKYQVFGVHRWEVGRIILFGMIERIPYDIEDVQELITPILYQSNILLSSDIFSSFNFSSLSLNSTLENERIKNNKIENDSEKKEGEDCYILSFLQTKAMEPNEIDILENRKSFDPRHRDPNDPLVIINGTIASPDCFFQIEVGSSPVIFEEYYNKALNYVITATILSFVQIYLLIRQLEHSSSQSAASKVSMLMIGMQANMDSILCIFHLTLGIIVEVTLNAFITAAFFKFIIFSIFEMRFLLIIWKSRNPDQQQEWSISMRQQLSSLYARIYTSLIMSVMLFYTFPEYFNYLIVCVYSFWVPQIYCNASRDAKFALDLKYLIGMSITRLFLPLYFYGCPSNFLHIEPNYTMVKIIFIWVFTQIAIIICQDKYGPRFFIPKTLLPKKYDYYHKFNFGEEEKDCVICMNIVDPYRGDYMITPCNHIYHANCLDQWLEQKMICPTCRTPLPPP